MMMTFLKNTSGWWNQGLKGNRGLGESPLLLKLANALGDLTYKNWVGKPEGKRPLGRPKRRCEDNIERNMKIFTGFKWSIWHFHSKCGSLGVEATDIFCCATIKQQLWNQEFLLAHLDANVKRPAGLYHIPHSQNRGWWAFAVLRTLITTCLSYDGLQ